MTDKEFKRLSRSELIDVIYQLQLLQDELTRENERLKAEVDDKRIRVNEAGNIAEAALEIHRVMQSAQAAANHYLEEMQLKTDDESRRIVNQAREEAAFIVEAARKEADEIIAKAKKDGQDFEYVIEAILKGSRQDNNNAGRE